MKKWLRPAVATASIVAVAAASVIVGAALAPTPALSSAPEPTVTAAFPVLQPVGYGDTWVPDAGADTAASDLVSPEHGTRVVPVDADGIPNPGAGVEEAARILGESADPVIDDPGVHPLGGPDDPCSPADGAPGGDCPEGLRGATFSVISPDSLWGMFRANPPVEITNPYEIAHCPAVEVGASAMRYSVVTNAPGAIQLRYWPRGDDRAATTINLSSSPQQTTDWESGLATAGAIEGDWITLQHCATLDGLEKYVVYDYELHVEDVLGREFTSSRTTPFKLPDDRTAPEFRVTPLGSNAILASAPHRADSEVRFTVQVLDPGDTNDCSATGDRLPLVDASMGAKTVDVDPGYLADHGYLPSYTKRTSIGVHVPSGSTVLVCAGVYDDDRPGWEWLEAQYRYSMVVQTPGGPRPVVSVDRLSLNAGYGDTPVRVDGRFDGTGAHLTCYLWNSQHGGGDTCGDDPHDVTRGGLWVTASARLGSDWTRYSALLPLGAVTCDPGCLAPDTAWYSVPVKLQERPGETCGSGIVGPCPETVIGTARIRVDWTLDPASSYGDHWTFSPPRAGAVERELDPLPQMDWLVEPEIIETADATTSGARLALKVDRPVAYRVELLGECGIPGMNRVVAGETRTAASVTFLGLCRGERYSMQVTLTDETGSTNVFGSPGGGAWPYSSFVTPGFTYNVVLGQRLGLKEEAHQLKVKRFSVRVDGQSIEPNLPENWCVLGNTVENPPSAALESARLGQLVTVEVTVQLADSTGSSEGTRAFCNAGTASGTPVYTMTVDVPIDDLLAGAVIAAPADAPYVIEVTLRLGTPT